MAVTFPRISITVDDDRGMGTQGELSALSLGFGIHQAWIYSAMFGSTTIFRVPSSFGVDGNASGISLVFIISILVFAFSLIFAAVTDQKLLQYYTSKQVIVFASILTSVGTFAVFATPLGGAIGMAAMVFAGVATGIGSSLLLLFWGVSYSRNGAATIVLNTAIAIVIAVAIYSFALHVIPAPFSGILAACLPLLELPLLWSMTPISYALRHAVPIFNPLPVKKLPFSIRLGFPVLLFGFSLGTFRALSIQVILPSSDLTTQLLALFAGGAATILLMITVFAIDKRSHWDFLFRPFIPFILVTLFFLPSLTLESSMIPSLVLLTGYMCFEALMWVFFGELAQEFRVSPIFVFGIGRGCLALGSIAGSLALANPAVIDTITPFGDAGGAVLLMLTMVVAYALLPRVRDIKRIAIGSKFDGAANVAAVNKQVEQVSWANKFRDEDKSLGGYGFFRSSYEPFIDNPFTQISPPEGKTASGDTAESAAGGLATTNDPEETRAKEEAAQAERSKKSGRFRAQCETIANRYLLSRRETEVMFLLAKGHNAAFIQEKLCISKSTAKTHISHIYRKLDIHNQQELLAMVDEAREPR